MARPVDIARKRYESGIDQSKYEKGIDAVRENPAEKAVKEKDRFQRNTLAGKPLLLKKLSAVSEADWKTDTKDAFPKLREKAVNAVKEGKWPAGKVLEAAKSAHETVKNLPKNTYHDSYVRMMDARKAIRRTYGYA